MTERTVSVNANLRVPQFQPLERVIYPILSRRLGKSIEGLFDIQEDAGATDEFIGRYKLGDYGVVAMNHLCYADPMGIMKQMGRVRRLTNANGFLLILSLTLVNGIQAEGNRWYKPLVGFLDNNFIDPVPVATINDFQRLLKKGYSNEQAEHIQRSVNAAAARRIRNARRDDLIVLTMPEGTLEGARLDKDGKLNGMQKVKDTAFGRILGSIVEGKPGQSGDFVTLPVGIWGSEKLLNPTTYKAGWKVWIELIKGFLPFVPQLTFANARIGTPFGKDEFKQHLLSKGEFAKAPSDLDLGRFMKHKPHTFYDFLMGERIAPLVPLKYRGFYRKDPVLAT